MLSHLWHIPLFPYCWFCPFLPYLTKITVLTKHISALVRNCKSIFSMWEYLQLIWSTSSTYLISCVNICSEIQNLTVSYSVAFVPSFVNRCQFPVYCVVLCGSRPFSTFLIFPHCVLKALSCSFAESYLLIFGHTDQLSHPSLIMSDPTGN